MKDFRDELLELLLANVGEFIDIQPLVDKYCGKGNTFDEGDETKVKCRLNINLHLRELKEMGWILMTTQGGLGTGHSFNHALGKRQFILDNQVKVRMTTKGEIEYKKAKHDPQPSYQATFTAPFTGNFSQGNPGNIQQTFNEPKKSEKAKWLTFNFWWEETLKHWYKLVLAAIGVVLLSWLGFHFSKGKTPVKQGNKQQLIQPDTIKKNDTADK